MAAAVATAAKLRSGIAALCSPAVGLLSASSASLGQQPKCTIVSKALRDPDYKRPAPFPYKTKKYNLFRALFDDVSPRMDENSKIIVIDGPPTGGKTQLGKQIAEELDMLHMPHANLDYLFINEYGFDKRTLDPQMPPSCRSWSVDQFLKKPTSKNTAKLAMDMLRVKFHNYIDATAHVLNTGQGVVMNRSIYSDFVFIEAMFKHGFLSPLARQYYYECKGQGMWEFMRPHLVIYLDIPVETVISNAKARNRPNEADSPFFKPEVLKTIDSVYKKEYLTDISKHSEVLIYDWSEGGDAEVLVEDICSLDLDKYTVYDSKMEDWRLGDEWDWKGKRITFSNDFYIDEMRTWLEVPRQYVPELIIPADDFVNYQGILDQAPGCKYEYGYNADMGDNVLFKNTLKSKYI